MVLCSFHTQYGPIFFFIPLYYKALCCVTKHCIDFFFPSFFFFYLSYLILYAHSLTTSPTLIFLLHYVHELTLNGDQSSRRETDKYQCCKTYLKTLHQRQTCSVNTDESHLRNSFLKVLNRGLLTQVSLTGTRWVILRSYLMSFVFSLNEQIGQIRRTTCKILSAIANNHTMVEQVTHICIQLIFDLYRDVVSLSHITFELL